MQGQTGVDNITGRVTRLVLEADTFDDERILRGLSEALQAAACKGHLLYQTLDGSRRQLRFKLGTGKISYDR